MAKTAKKTKKTTAKKTKKAPAGGSAKPKTKPTPSQPADASVALKPPPGGAAVRMYRIGHGDCFLIAFAGENPDKPAYVLIDCGYKPGSPGKLAQPTKVKEIGENIIATTGGFVDVAIVTHEHQDHVNGLTPGNFPGLKVGKVWFAWTENPKDDIANQLRKKFKDRLLGLIDARANLLGLGNNEAAEDLDWYLQLELGEEAEDFNGLQHLAAKGKDPASSANKVAMKFLRDCGNGDPDYLYPHERCVRCQARRAPAHSCLVRRAISTRSTISTRSGRRLSATTPMGWERLAEEGRTARKLRRSRAAMCSRWTRCSIIRSSAPSSARTTAETTRASHERRTARRSGPTPRGAG